MRRTTPPQWVKLMESKSIGSIRQLADKAGVSHPAVARLIHREGVTKDENIVAVAETLGVTPARIYELAGMNAPSEAGPYVPPEEAARLTTRQREALTELIRAMVDPKAPAKQTVQDGDTKAQESKDSYRLAARHGMDEDRKKRR